MKDKNANSPMKFCVAITTGEFEKLRDFYRIGLGYEPTEDWGSDGGQNYVVDMGKAIFEVIDEKQAATIDELEVGERVSGKLRFALQVPNLDAAVVRLTDYGATLVSPPQKMSWGDRIARFKDPEGIQLTLFESAAVAEK